MIYFISGLMILMGVAGSETIPLLNAILISIIGGLLMFYGTIRLNEKYGDSE